MFGGLKNLLKALFGGLGSALGLFGRGLRAGFNAALHALGKLGKRDWTNAEQYGKLLPEGLDDSDAEFAGAHMGVAVALAAHWFGRNKARIALYVLALLSLVLLVTGLYLYMRDYRRFVQREADQKNGVYRSGAMVAKAREAQVHKVVDYVPLTPPNLVPMRVV